MKTRKEYDSLGQVKVPVDKYWGASTERSKRYFNIGDILINPIIIQSIGIIKKSAAIVHLKDKKINKKVGKAIIKASDEYGEVTGLITLEDLIEQIVGQ